MKNRNFKKWKKSHRQRRKSRMIYINVTLDEEVLNGLKEYCKKCHISLTSGIHRCLHRAMKKYEMENNEGI